MADHTPKALLKALDVRDGHVCAVDDCGAPAYRPGICGSHYMRWARTGKAEKPTLEELMWPNVEPTGFCWEWIGRRDHEGYGVVEVDRKHVRAHRASYELLVGPIPDGLVMDHLCRIRHCVNPDHLEPVTRSENSLRAQAYLKPTHCIRGHEFDEANTGIRPNGKRVCRACDRISHRERSRRRG